MPPRLVTTTDFQNRAGQYLDKSGEAPVFITRHDRPVRVLLDIEEYERLSRAKTEGAAGEDDIDGLMKAAVADHQDLLKQLAQR